MEHRFRPSSPEIKKLPPVDLIARARERGSFEFDRVNQAERSALIEWFKQHGNELSSTEQTNFLEQAMLHNLMSDAETISCLDRLLPKDAATLAFFVAKTQPIGRYNLTFQRAFCRLAADEKPEIEKQVTELIDLCLSDYRRLISPFIAWSGEGKLVPKYETTEDTEGRHRLEPATYDTAEKMLSELMMGYESLNSLHGSSAEALKKNIRKNFSELLPKWPLLVYPHLSRLIDSGLVDPENEEVKKILFGEPNTRTMLTNTKTDDEQRAFDALIKRHNGDYLYEKVYRLQPASDAALATELNDEPMKRACKAVFGTFETYRERLTVTPEKFVESYGEANYPIFLEIEHLGFSFKELKSLLLNPDVALVTCFDGSDLIALLNYNRTHRKPDDPDLEKTIVNRIQHDIIHHESDVLKFLAPRLQDILPAFSPAAQKKIIDIINKYTPRVWLENPSYAVTVGKTSMEHLFAFSGKQSDEIIWELPRLFQLLRTLEKNGEAPIDTTTFKKRARAILERNSKYIFRKELKGLMPTLYTPEEFDGIIRRKLEHPVDKELLFALLGEKDFRAPYLDTCRDIIRTTKSLWGDITRFSHSWEKIEQLFSPEELLTLLETYRDTIDLRALFENHDTPEKILIPLKTENLPNVLWHYCSRRNQLGRWYMFCAALKTISKPTRVMKMPGMQSSRSLKRNYQQHPPKISLP